MDFQVKLPEWKMMVIPRGMLARGLLLGLAWHAAMAAADIDRLGHACGSGKKDACTQLVSIARNSGDEPLRRLAAERLIKERARACPSTTAENPIWRQGQRVLVNSEYLFEHELDAARQAEIAKAGDRFVAGALLSLGVETAREQDSAQAVVETTVFGSARAWIFSQIAVDGPRAGPAGGVGIVAYPDVAWKGVVTVRIAGRCVCSETLQEEAPRRGPIYGSLRRKPSDAPFRSDLESSLAPVMIRLGKELFGAAAIARMARNADSVKVRETALAQLRDQAALAGIARNDTNEHLRFAAVRKLTNQAALVEVARNEPSYSVRLSAVQRLADPVVLSDIAGSDQNPEVRREAQLRLEKLGKPR